MKTLKIESTENSDEFRLFLNGKNSCDCIVSDINLHDTLPTMSVKVAWLNKGRYTNNQRKKMVIRTMNKILRVIISKEFNKSIQNMDEEYV